LFLVRCGPPGEVIVKRARFWSPALLLPLLLVAFAGLPSAAFAQVGDAQMPTGTEVQYRALSTSTSAFTLTAKERLVIQLVNKARTSRGLAPVRANVPLVKAARGHSAEMVHRRYFSHDSHNGTAFWSRLIYRGYKRAGYSSWSVGECIGWGQGLLGTPQAIVSAWMHSPPHRAIILTSRFREVGVGVHSGTYMGGAFFFTLDFGRRSK
jgi:uncharacterized protein YkwD